MAIILRSDENYYRFEITIPNNTFYDDFVDVRFLDKPEISYNADYFDNESLFFPSNLKVKFFSDYNNLFNYFNNPQVRVDFYENNQLIFWGYLDIEETIYVPTTNEYTLTFIDYSKEISNKPFLQFGQYVNNNNPVLLTDIITTLISPCTVVLRFNANYITFESSFYDSFSGNYYKGGFDKFGTFPSYFFDGTYKTAFDIIKNMLFSLGLLGFFEGNKLVIKPRFSFSNPLVCDELVDAEIENQIVKSYDYIIADVRTSTPGQRQQKIYDYRINILEEPKKQITHKFEIVGGTEPDGNLSFNNLFIYVPAYITGLGNDAFYIGRMNTFQLNSGIPGSVWGIIADTTANRLSQTRLKISGNMFHSDTHLFDIINYRNHNYIITSVRRKVGENLVKFTALSI
jgi:hypothetical protein